MAKKTAKRVKHVPQRTCVGCRQTLAKRSLIRVVRTPEGLRVDPTGKIPGRGAYLHDHRACWERGIKSALAHALKIELTGQDRETLRNFMATLPDEGPLPQEEPLTQEEISPLKEGSTLQEPVRQKKAPADKEQDLQPDREEHKTLGQL